MLRPPAALALLAFALPAPAQPAASAGAGADGFSLRSADGAFALRLRGGVQYDGRFFLEDDAEAAASTFAVRRVRTEFAGTLHRDYDFRVNLDFAGSRVELLDAYVDARLLPALRLRAGKLKGPVGLERLQTPFAVAFHERALPTALVPNRDVGVQAHGTLLGGALEYQAGVFNGVPDGGSEDQDTGDGKDLAARLFVHPFRGVPGLGGLGVGVAATTGTQEGSAALPLLPAFRTSGREVFFRYRGDGTAAGTAAAAGRRTRLAPQAAWYAGPVGATAEWVRSRQRVARGAAEAELETVAWQVTGTVVLAGGRPSYRGVVPERPFDPARGSWGAWEVGARLNALAVDPAAFPAFADSARSVRRASAAGVVANAYLNRAVRVLLAYERTRFDAAPGGAARPAEHLLVTRLQLAF